MNTLSPLQNFIYRIGALLLIAGVLLWQASTRWGIIVYSIGACMFASMQMAQRYEGKNVVLRRLRRQQLLGAFFLLLTGVLMEVAELSLGFLYHNDWMVSLAIAGLLEIYTAFRIPYVLEQEQKDNSKE